MSNPIKFLIAFLVVYFLYSQFGNHKTTLSTGSHVSLSAFDESINSAQPVLVKFGATWCGPCRKVDVELDKIQGELTILKIDIDVNGELAERYNVSGIPHMILFANGRPLADMVGYRPAEQISSWARQYGASTSASSDSASVVPAEVQSNPFAI